LGDDGQPSAVSGRSLSVVGHPSSVNSPPLSKEHPMPTLATNGINLHYERHGEGPPLVFITGVGYGAWFWHKLVPLLSQHFEVITLDNRGAGQSAKPEGPYTANLMAGDVAGLMDALEIKWAYIIGHSLGGFIAQELVLARPDLVSKLVLAGTSHGGPNAVPIPPEALDVLTNRTGDSLQLLRRGLAIATAPGFAERQPAIMEELFQYRLTNPVPPVQYQAQVMAGVGHNAEDRLGLIRCPTLVLCAEHDRVVPPGNGPLMVAKIPGAKLKLLPDVGHLFPIEDPATTARLLFDFWKHPERL
jgi:3-oxoadipate enol-lactonase